MFVTELQPSDLHIRWDAKTGPIGKILTITFPFTPDRRFIVTAIGGISYLVDMANGNNYTRPQFIKAFDGWSVIFN